MRQILVVETTHGRRFKVRYRLGGKETSETFIREADARTFRDILGNGKDDRVTQALKWLSQRRTDDQAATVTFGSFFEHYVDQLTGVTPRTRDDYRSMRRRYLRDLDPLPLSMISRAHVTGLVNDLERAGRAAKTIKQTVHMLSTCLSLAIYEGHIATNPCQRIRLPATGINGVEARFLSPDEFRTLLAVMPERYQPLLTFLVGTGMRWSEATAVEARHVDLRGGTVRVEQAWKRVPGQGFALGPPKTSKAKRTVNPAVAALLAAQPLMRRPRDLLFVTASGGPVRHANFFTNVWQPACARAELDPAPRIHDTRHTHASWLISEGVSLEAVQDQLGHESIETTRKVYAKLMPAVGVAVGRAASAAMSRALVSDEDRRELLVEPRAIGGGEGGEPGVQ